MPQIPACPGLNSLRIDQGVLRVEQRTPQRSTNLQEVPNSGPIWNVRVYRLSRCRVSRADVGCASVPDAEQMMGNTKRQRRNAGAGTAPSTCSYAACATIRAKLLKIAAQVCRSMHRPRPVPYPLPFRSAQCRLVRPPGMQPHAVITGGFRKPSALSDRSLGSFPSASFLGRQARVLVRAGCRTPCGLEHKPLAPAAVRCG
jgi:hypothetical protein